MPKKTIKVEINTESMHNFDGKRVALITSCVYCRHCQPTASNPPMDICTHDDDFFAANRFKIPELCPFKAEVK